MSAIQMQIHLQELQMERALASIEGLASDLAYMADLEDHIAAARDAYLCAALTEIATLRGELFGRQVG